MALFPMTEAGAAFTLDEPQSLDPYFQGIRTKNDFSAAFASLSEGIGYSNGLRLLANGQLSIVDASNGLPADAAYINGLPLTSDGKLCVSTNAIATWSNGIAFDANGAVVITLTFKGVLDQISAQSAAAFSLRRLRGLYDGSAIRVRRSTDNIEANIGFDSRGNFDVFALGRHVPAQNLSLQSSTPANSIWVALGGSKGAVTVLDPSGSSDAVVYTANGVSGAHRISNDSTFATTAGVTYTTAWYVRPLTQTTVQLVPPSVGFGPTAFCNFTLDGAGAVGSSGGGLTGAITALGDGWYRISITAAATGSNSAVGSGVLFLVTSSTSARAETNTLATSVAVWGSQVSASSAPLLYSPTTTAAIASSASGFVSAWYDQSGNGRDLIQATSTFQPRIVNSGVVDISGLAPIVRFLGGNGLYRLNAALTTQMMNVVGFITATSGVQHFVRQDAGGQSIWLRALNTSLNFALPSTSTSVNATYTSANLNRLTVISGTGSESGLARLFANGSQLSTANSLSPVTYTNNLGVGMQGLSAPGGTSPETLIGAIAEICLFPSSLSTADRQTLERNQGTYYGITVA